MRPNLRLVGGTDFTPPAAPSPPAHFPPVNYTPKGVAARQLIYDHELAMLPGTTVFQALRWVCDEAGDEGCDLGDLGPHFDALRSVALAAAAEQIQESPARGQAMQAPRSSTRDTHTISGPRGAGHAVSYQATRGRRRA